MRLRCCDSVVLVQPPRILRATSASRLTPIPIKWRASARSRLLGQLRHVHDTPTPPSQSNYGQLRDAPKVPCAGHHAPKPTTLPATSLSFWTCKATWRRAGINTLRCLIGCTTGDFSAMWYLQTYHAGLGLGTIMAVSMASGLGTSMLLETVLLRFGRDRLAWPVAAKTAVGMSLISMLTMEAAENVVDYHLTGGAVTLDSPAFWAAAAGSMAAGFLAPLPYNYLRLRRYGKVCH